MHFTANNQSSTYFDEKEILSYLPTGISRTISLELYSDLLSHSPVFRLLGAEVLLQLCESVVPVSVVKSQTVFKRGDVGHVSCHDIAGIWVAFFSRCQRYRC